MSHAKKRTRNGHVSWEAVINDPDHPKGEWSRTFDTKREADTFIKKIEGEKATSSYISPVHGETPFLARYNAWTEGRVTRDSTNEAQESYARSLVLPTFGLLPIGEIRHDVIQTWVRELLDAGYAPATIHKAHGVLAKVLAQCVANRLLPSNPCDHTDLPTVEMEEMRFLNHDQVMALAEAIDPRYMLFVILAAYSGLRAGELFGLRVGRLDLIRNELDVVENCVLVRNKIAFHKPKTRAGKRRVPIPPFVGELAAAHIAGKSPTDLVFTAPGRRVRAERCAECESTELRGRGLCGRCYQRHWAAGTLPALAEPQLGSGPVSLRMFRRRFWYPATIAAGLGMMTACAGEECSMCRQRPGDDEPTRRAAQHYSGLRIHDLRHTAVSFWIDLGANQLEVARRAGHVSVATVYDRYGHLFPRDEDPAMAKLDAVGRAALARLQGAKAPSTRG